MSHNPNDVIGPSVIELDPNVELPIKTEQPLDFRSKRNHKETIKKVASDKAAKTLLGLVY